MGHQRRFRSGLPQGAEGCGEFAGLETQAIHAAVDLEPERNVYSWREAQQGIQLPLRMDDACYPVLRQQGQFVRRKEAFQQEDFL